MSVDLGFRNSSSRLPKNHALKRPSQVDSGILGSDDSVTYVDDEGMMSQIMRTSRLLPYVRFKNVLNPRRVRQCDYVRDPFATYW